MNLRKLKRRARFILLACLLVVAGGQIAFYGDGFNRQSVRFGLDFLAAFCLIWWLGVEHLYLRKQRRMLKRKEAKAVQQGIEADTMEMPLIKLRPFWGAPRRRQKRDCLMPSPPGTTGTPGTFTPDAEINSDVEAMFLQPKNNNIYWEGPTYPPKKTAFSPTTLAGYDALAVFTVDASKANGYAISEPANASPRAVAQVARLKALYE